MLVPNFYKCFIDMITYKLRKRVRVIHALLTIVLTFSTYGALIYAWNENHHDIIFGCVFLATLFTCGIYPWIKFVSHSQASKNVIITYEPETGAITYTNNRVYHEFNIDDVVEIEGVTSNGVFSGLVPILTYHKIWIKGIRSCIEISSMLRAKELLKAIEGSPHCECTQETTFWTDLEN